VRLKRTSIMIMAIALLASVSVVGFAFENQWYFSDQDTSTNSVAVDDVTEFFKAVTFKANGGIFVLTGTSADIVIEVGHGKTVDVTSIPSVSYNPHTFVFWTLNPLANPVVPFDFNSPITTNVTVLAEWTP